MHCIIAKDFVFSLHGAEQILQDRRHALMHIYIPSLTHDETPLTVTATVSGPGNSNQMHARGLPAPPPSSSLN